MTMSHKLENPKRVEELSPVSTLKRIGLKDGDTFCDVGAGTGIFTFAAAGLTRGNVYAVELSQELLDILAQKKRELNAQNVIIQNSISQLPSASCHLALLCAVLHELREAETALPQLRRALTPDGVLAVIEFHKRPTPMGPPPEHRLSPEQAEEMLLPYGFHRTDYFELGENYYILLFSA